jgi:hypothetical protein
MKENRGIIVNKENNTVTCTASSSQFGIRRGGPCGCVVPKELEFEAESQKWTRCCRLVVSCLAYKGKPNYTTVLLCTVALQDMQKKEKKRTLHLQNELRMV